MKRILIIDDRPLRKQQYLSDESLKDIETLADHEQLDIFDDIEDETVFFNNLNRYDLIAIHRSLLIEKSLYEKTRTFVIDNNKYLILFSGGTLPNQILDKGHILSINAADFYSSKLISFVKDFLEERIKYPLTQFLYGEKWKLSMLLQYRNLLWIYDDLSDIEADDDYSNEELWRNILNPNATEPLSEEWINNEIKMWED